MNADQDAVRCRRLWAAVATLALAGAARAQATKGRENVDARWISSLDAAMVLELAGVDPAAVGGRLDGDGLSRVAARLALPAGARGQPGDAATAERTRREGWVDRYGPPRGERRG